jgi:hypothetical protein
MAAAVLCGSAFDHCCRHAWYQSGRINDLRDSLGKRIDDLRSNMNTRFGAVEKRLDKLEEKVEGLMERSWR